MFYSGASSCNAHLFPKFVCQNDRLKPEIENPRMQIQQNSALQPVTSPSVDVCAGRTSTLEVRIPQPQFQQFQVRLTGKTPDLIRRQMNQSLDIHCRDVHTSVIDPLAATTLFRARKQEWLTGPWTRCNSGPKCDALSCSTWSKQKSDPVDSNWW